MKADGQPAGDPGPAGPEPTDGASKAEELAAALATQVRMLWELEIGDVPMALRFEPSPRRG